MNRRTSLNLAIALFFLSTPLAAQIRAGMPARDPVDAREARFLTSLRQLTSQGERSGEAYFSPDGKTAIFQSVQEVSPHYQIYTLALDVFGATPQLVSTGKGKTTCAFFHPHQPRIIYASTHLDESTWAADPEDHSPRKGYTWDMAPAMDIFAADLDGKNLAQLTDAKGYDAEGAFSPDGQRIAYTGMAGDDPEIWIMDSNGANRQRLTNAAGYDGGPFISPDGKSVVFRSFRDDQGNCQVHVIDVDGQNERQLTTKTAINWCPYWHPSGKYLVYSSNVGSFHNFELFLMRIDGSGITRLTYSAGADILPVFSPDGSRLMWTSTRGDGKSQVMIAEFWMPADDKLGDDTATLDIEATDQEAYSRAYPSRHGRGGQSSGGQSSGNSDGKDKEVLPEEQDPATTRPAK